MSTPIPILDPAWLQAPLVGPAEATRYIPQQPPFALVDTLYHHEPAQAWAGLLVRPDNLLVQDGYLSEAGIIESMAQAVALKSGYEARQAAPGAAPRVGFIAALKDVQVQALVPVGRTLITHAEILLQALDVLVVRTRSYYDHTWVAQAEMRLFLEPAPAATPAPAAALAPLTLSR